MHKKRSHGKHMSSGKGEIGKLYNSLGKGGIAPAYKSNPNKPPMITKIKY